jgi:hypothetical protein
MARIALRREHTPRNARPSGDPRRPPGVASGTSQDRTGDISMSRFTPVRPRTAAFLLASAGAALSLAPKAHAGPTTTNWAAPVSGGFYDPANWSDGVGPVSGAPAIIDALGSAYQVFWSSGPGQGNPLTESVLLDSNDATLIYRDASFQRLPRFANNLTIRRGILDVQGTINAPGDLRIESDGTVQIGADDPTFNFGFRGAQFALDVINDGHMNFAGTAGLSQIIPGQTLPSGISMINNAGGVMRFAGGNYFTGGVLINHGTIALENDPAFDNDPSQPPPLRFPGTVFGPVDFQPTTFNNHGTVRVEQGRFAMGSDGLHSGQFELLHADAALSIGGDNWFLPGSRITGPGTTLLNRFGSVGGALTIEGDLELDTGVSSIGASLDVGGNVRLDGFGGDVEFASAIRANLIERSNSRNFRFLNAADIAFDDAIGSAEFFAPAIVRSDLVSLQDRSVFHQYADIAGSVGNAAFMREAFIGGNASNVEFNRGASIGGDLTGGATAIGRVNIQGDLIATSGAWSFTGDGAVDALLDVTGDIAITRPFEIRGDIIAQGAFSALQGRFANITADTVRFGASTASTHGNISIFGNASIETGGSRAIIDRARIASDFNQAPTGSENVTFVNGFEVIYNPVTQFTRSGFSVVVNADTMRETTFRFLADSILAGTLDVSVIGDASSLSYGDTFTILDARPFDTGDPVATITGEFDRLFLPSLSDDLYFDVVYEPSAVRLVVVPAPGPVSLLALAGLATARRRRSRATAVAATTLLASAGATIALAPTAHAGPTTIWAAPVSGGFFDSANWENGLLPSDFVSALISATGSPYTVTLSTNRASLAIPITIDSDDATLRYSSDFTNFTSPTQSGSLDVLRGALVIAESTEMRNLAPINVAAAGRIQFDGSLTQSVQQRRIRFGRDLNLEGDAAFAGRATLTMYDESLFSGFPVPRFSIADSGYAEFAGGNLIAGGIITNNGSMRFINDPVYNEDNFSFELFGSRIGFESDNDSGFTTTFFNNGAITVDQGDLTLGAIGSHSGEFHLDAGSRLVLEETQNFAAQSRVTGAGVVVAETPERISGFLQTEGDLVLERGGVMNAALDIGGSIEVNGFASQRDVDFASLVRVGGSFTAVGSALIFRNGFDGAISGLIGGGADLRARSLEFFGAAHIRGDAYTLEGATFHGLATIEGSIADAVFASTATIQGDATNSVFRQAATVGGDGAFLTLDRGGEVGGNLTGVINSTGMLIVGGDFTQTGGSRSTIGARRSGDRFLVGGDVDILSPFFESTIPIVAEGSFRAYAGSFRGITASAVTFGGQGALGTATVELYPNSTVESVTGPTQINRARIAVDQIWPGVTGDITFVNGFEVTYIPINAFTRSGFSVRINLEGGRNDLFAFLADSILAGTLDVAVIGDPTSLSYGDSFTILEGRVPFGSTDPVPTISGEFDRLFLPSLSDDLYFDVVYEPSAVRLVVVPAPGAALVLAMAGIAPPLARRRRSVLSES